MKSKSRKTLYKRIALALSLCALIVWGVLGTGASLAWFTDSTPEINNIFNMGEFDLTVYHRLTDGKWEEVESETKIFDENALYEPGYVQVVYLKVKNTGTLPFDFYAAVIVNDCIMATNVFGQQFMLQDYLKFGLTISDSEEEMKNSVPDRETAVEIANMPLHNYYETNIDDNELAPDEEKYIALIVRMPEDVTNIANYRGTPTPEVQLGLNVTAEQISD